MTATRDIQVLLNDMLQSVRYIQQWTHGIALQQFEQNPQLQAAVLHHFVVMGEAAGSLPQDWRAYHPQIPWRVMIGARNVIIHGYFHVDLQIIWQTIQTDLPKVAIHLVSILANEFP